MHGSHDEESELLSVRLSFMQMLQDTGNVYALVLILVRDVLEFFSLFVEISVFRMHVFLF